MSKLACFFLGFLLLLGCSPSSLEDFQGDSESICREIVNDLKTIYLREDLVKNVPRLRKKFIALVDVIIEARKFQESHPEEMTSFSLYSDEVQSEHLREELERIYHIEGGKELIEKAQKEALLRLDAFERQIKKQKNKRSKGIN
jgi:hypothetical protein